MHARDMFCLLLVVSCVASTVRAVEPPRTGSGIDVAPGDCRGVDLRGLRPAAGPQPARGDFRHVDRAALTAAVRPTRLLTSARTAAAHTEVRCIRQTTAAEITEDREFFFPFPPPPDAP